MFKKDFFVKTSKDKIVVNHYNIYKYNRPTAAFCLNTKDSKWKAIIITYLLHRSIDEISCIQTRIHNNIRQNHFDFQGLFYNVIIRSAQFLIYTFYNIKVMYNIIWYKYFALKDIKCQMTCIWTKDKAISSAI